MIADEITHGGILDIILSLWVPVSITAAATIYVAAIARANRKRLDTGNGRSLGETVHDIAQTVEVLSAQVHTNTQETLDALEASKKVAERLDAWITESSYVHAQMLKRLPPEEGP